MNGNHGDQGKDLLSGNGCDRASEEQRERVMRLWKNAPEFERGRIIGRLEALVDKAQEQKSA